MGYWIRQRKSSWTGPLNGLIYQTDSGPEKAKWAYLPLNLNGYLIKRVFTKVNK